MDIPKKTYFVFNNSLIESLALPKYLTSDGLVIYEVIRIIDKKILFLEDHIERLLTSLETLQIHPLWSRQQITHQLLLLIQSSELENTNIKFQIQVDQVKEAQNFIAYFIPHAYPTEDQYKYGVRASILNASRKNPNAKVQNLTLRQKADEIIKNENVYEVILSQNGIITEGSRSNLFSIKGSVVKTPQIEDVLPGVTRKHLIQVCNDLKIQCHEEKIMLDALLTMDALFISGTSPKVLPIKSINNHYFDVNNPILRNIMAKFDEHINSYFKSQPILL